MSETKSYIRDCSIEPKNGNDTLFHVKANGDVVATLKGYAIIPRKKYEELCGTTSE